MLCGSFHIPCYAASRERDRVNPLFNNVHEINNLLSASLKQIHSGAHNRPTEVVAATSSFDRIVRFGAMGSSESVGATLSSSFVEFTPE